MGDILQHLCQHHWHPSVDSLSSRPLESLVSTFIVYGCCGEVRVEKGGSVEPRLTRFRSLDPPIWRRDNLCFNQFSSLPMGYSPHPEWLPFDKLQVLPFLSRWSFSLLFQLFIAGMCLRCCYSLLGLLFPMKPFAEKRKKKKKKKRGGRQATLLTLASYFPVWVVPANVKMSPTPTVAHESCQPCLRRYLILGWPKHAVTLICTTFEKSQKRLSSIRLVQK